MQRVTLVAVRPYIYIVEPLSESQLTEFVDSPIKILLLIRKLGYRRGARSMFVPFVGPEFYVVAFVHTWPQSFELRKEVVNLAHVELVTIAVNLVFSVKFGRPKAMNGEGIINNLKFFSALSTCQLSLDRPNAR